MVHGRSYLSESIDRIDHPARELLQAYRDEGVPVIVNDEMWSPERLQRCLRRGAHPSAIEHKEFLRDEMADFCERGFWVVLPYDLVRHLDELKLSPSAVKPERDRRPRLLVDHTWFGVNDATQEYPAKEVMQFGHALPRVLHRVHHSNPSFGPVYLAKFDISDGFYRMATIPKQAPNLAVILPPYDGEPQLVAIPLVCTMGWVNSPPSFCAMSETVADIANSRMFRHHALPHRLEEAADSPNKTSEAPPPKASVADPNLPEFPQSLPVPPDAQVRSAQPSSQPESHVDVFVDDFIGVTQGSPNRRRIVRRILMHTVDDVLARPAKDEPFRQEAISLKKLLQGDGRWDTRKLILGWIIDTVKRTIELPPHRQQRLQEIFDSLRGLRRISHKNWERIIGELRFMSLAIPGSGGLFSALQLGLKHSDKHRIRITKHIRHHLTDFERLTRSLMERPTRLGEIVPDHPCILGAVDACKAGMGGVLFTENHRPVLWRERFPEQIQRRLVSFDNPNGDLTNSDLEQTGVLAQADIATNEFDIRERTLATLSDNTPAISRNHKGAVTTDQAGAYTCRMASMHQRHYRYIHEVGFINGDRNGMSDTLSRAWHLSDAQILTHFDSMYPQTKPWRMCQLPSASLSALISCLDTKPSDPASYLRPELPKKIPGVSGAFSAISTGRIPTSSPTTAIPSTSSSSSACDTAVETLERTAGEGSPQVALASELRQFRTPYKPSARGSPNWMAKTHGSHTKASTSGSQASTSTSKTKTPQPLASGPSASPSSKPSTNACKHTRTQSSPRPSSTSLSWPSTSCADRANTQSRPARTMGAALPSDYKTCQCPRTHAKTSTPPRAL